MLVGRYAPSPTGRLHLGNARTALLAWLQARAAGGRFLMRIEDLDPQRSKPEHEARQLEDLRWLGLDWDEGPDVGGLNGPYRQSERGELYAAALARLDSFACSCTRRELRETASAPHGREAIYPGTCAGSEGPRTPERPLAQRWRVPPGELCFEDLIMGELREDVRAQVGDFVLRRGDGAWAYQLAVVVDDAAMGVTHVLRGADLLTSTARQLLLAQTLGYPLPRHAHAPLVVASDGSKLNKRHGAPDLSALREANTDPRVVVAALARSAGLFGDEPAPARITAHELLPGFELARIGREAGPLALDELPR